MRQTQVAHRSGLRDEQQRLYAPCRARCPVHIDVPGYLAAIGEGRFTDALEIVLERNPLPSVCGRVCLHPCEDGCRRCLLDDPIAIAQLKRAAADFGVYPRPEHPRLRPEKIAIVGSGPTGLTAAHDLANRGFQVTLYEEKPLLGGTMRYGIPNYRLPDYALDRDIDYILSAGIAVNTGIRVGRDVMLDELAASHRAVVITAGLQGSRALPIPGVDSPRVLTALPFLEASSRGEDVDLGNRVVVVGGGNVAMDVARTARRQGASDVHVVCLESSDEIPASPQEIHDADIEGITLHYSWGPRSISHEAGTCALNTVRCTSVFNAEKRFAPSFDESVAECFEADTIIFAIGQSADVGDLGIALTSRGAPQIDPLTLKTSIGNVYAAGDVVSGPTKIIDAIAAGHRVAATAYRDITCDTEPLRLLDEEIDALGEVPDTMANKLETRRRIQMEHLEFFDAVKTFDEIEGGYTEYEAAREAQRCLSCTTGARLTREKCSLCLTCIRVCPHGAPILSTDGYVYFDAAACNACGACQSQCPSQAIVLEGHSEQEMSRRVERQLWAAEMDTTLMFACSSTPIVPNLGGTPPRIITVTCLLRVSERTVLEALQNGATRVVFAGCVESTCRFLHARELVRQRSGHIEVLLSRIGMTNAFDFVEHKADDLDWHLR
ncbi:MAG: FAD-dependent oxidoreductase [Coriobacteriia bacterium]|nr:FAD-dependent oxidoreductase [Coriobacteriia bacterium]